MADYSDLIPANLRASVSDGTNLKPSITTSSYAGGTPAAAGDLKRSIAYADGTLKPSIANSAGIKASWLLAGSASPPVAAAGLTLIDSAEVSGGAVSSLSITVNLEAGKSYRIGMGLTTASGSAPTLRFNNQASGYLRGWFASGGGSGDDSSGPYLANANQTAAAFLGVGLLNSTPYAGGSIYLETSVNRAYPQWWYNSTETTVSTLVIVGSGNVLNNGTWLKCWRLD